MAKRKAADAAHNDANNDATAGSENTAETPLPNVKLAANAEPLGAGKLTVGMKVIGQMPSATAQAEGWHCPFVRQLLQLFPERFKLIVEKGK